VQFVAKKRITIGAANDDSLLQLSFEVQPPTYKPVINLYPGIKLFIAYGKSFLATNDTNFHKLDTNFVRFQAR